MIKAIFCLPAILLAAASVSFAETSSYENGAYGSLAQHRVGAHPWGTDSEARRADASVDYAPSSKEPPPAQKPAPTLTMAQTTTPSPAPTPNPPLKPNPALQPILGARLFMHNIPASPDLVDSQPSGWRQAIADPNTCGAQITIPWALVDNGTSYDWSAVDAYIALWAKQGKFVALHFSSAAALVSQEMIPVGSTTAVSNTPKYVLNSGLPIIQCHQELGEPGLFTPPTPDFLDGRYLIPWKKFITASVERYANDPQVAYLYFAIGAEESFPETEEWLDPNCLRQLKSVGITAQTWLAHAIDMVDFLGSLRPGAQISWGLNDQGTQLDLDATDHFFVTTVAAEARKYGFIVGNDGFPNAFLNWTGLYTVNAPYIYAQALTPQIQGGPGSFGSIIQEASALGIRTLELYPAEWSIAYDPNNPNYPQYGAAYQAALKSLKPVSGPVCRMGPGQY